MWIKVLEWLRLFDSTAFFFLLFEKTLQDMKHFVIFLLIWYMMFGTAVYILNFSIPSD